MQVRLGTYRYLFFFCSSEPEDYEGGRTASDIVRWAEEKAAENVAPPEVKQILGADSVKAGCEEHPLCVIAFLPNILDCQVCVTIYYRFSQFWIPTQTYPNISAHIYVEIKKYVLVRHILIPFGRRESTV